MASAEMIALTVLRTEPRHGVGYWTALRWCTSGRLRHVRVGRKLYTRDEWLLDAIQAQAVGGPGSEPAVAPGGDKGAEREHVDDRGGAVDRDEPDDLDQLAADAVRALRRRARSRPRRL